MKHKIRFPDRTVESTNTYLEGAAPGLELRDKDFEVTPYGIFCFESNGNAMFIPLLQVRRVGLSGDVTSEPVPHVSNVEVFEYRQTGPAEQESYQPIRIIPGKRKRKKS